MYRILIVEDDNTIMAILKRMLEEWNYQMTAVGGFPRVLEWLEEAGPSLVLLDMSLPFSDGYYWCEEMRGVSQVPIILISSASDDMNLVMVVNMGVDDFLAKPLKLEVVVAKIQALFRRAYAFREQKTVLRVGGAAPNPGDRTLDVGNRKLELMKNELRILNMPMERKGTVVSRDDMIRQPREHEDSIDDNTLTVNVTRLRRKLEGMGLSELIEAKKGLGYLASEDGERVAESWGMMKP